MAHRPEKDYKIIKSNNSSYNLLSHHRNHVPDTPLFRPGEEPSHMTGVKGGDGREWKRHPDTDRGAYNATDTDYTKGVSSYNPANATNNYNYSNNYSLNRRTGIDHDENNLPFSPLYRGGGGGGGGGGHASRRADYDDRRDGAGGGGYGRDSSPDKLVLDPRHGTNSDPQTFYEREPEEDTRGEYYQGITSHSPAPVNAPAWANRSTNQDGPVIVRDSSPVHVTNGVDVPTGWISHRNHVPDSPLYRPKDSKPPPHHQEDMPDPSYNTTHLRFEENSTKPQPPSYIRPPLSSRYHDIRDYRGNPMPNRGAYTDRGDYDRDPRSHPWENPANFKDNMIDPRHGLGVRGLTPQEQTHAGTSKNGGALLFIRFNTGDGEKIPVVSHAFRRATVTDTGGRYLGMSKKVYDFGSGSGSKEAMGVFHFPNMDNALKFFQYDFAIRQPDFPGPYGTASMWIICNAYLPDNMDVFNTFLLSDIQLHAGRHKRSFFEEVQKSFEKYLYANGVMPFVVCSYGKHDRQSIRRHAYQPDHIVTCHLFQGLDHLRWLSEQNEYCKYRSLHNTWATETCSVFTLSKDL